MGQRVQARKRGRMTREQAINYLFSSGFTEEQVSEVVRALTYKPIANDEIKNSIEMLKILKGQARKVYGNTHLWDISKESFDFVIDKTIKDLYTVLGEAE